MYEQCLLLAMLLNGPSSVRLSTVQMMNPRMAAIARGELVAIRKEAVVAY
jgi:hypothetical protein